MFFYLFTLLLLLVCLLFFFIIINQLKCPFVLCLAVPFKGNFVQSKYHPSPNLHPYLYLWFCIGWGAEIGFIAQIPRQQNFSLKTQILIPHNFSRILSQTQHKYSRFQTCETTNSTTIQQTHLRPLSTQQHIPFSIIHSESQYTEPITLKLST